MICTFKAAMSAATFGMSDALWDTLAVEARRLKPGQWAGAAYFNRVLKADRFLSGRAAEIAAYQAEQERLKMEAGPRRVENR